MLGFPKFLPASFLTQFPIFNPRMKVEGSKHALLWFKASTQVLGEVIDSSARAGMMQGESGESYSYQNVRKY